jgi:hypothetical protein
MPAPLRRTVALLNASDDTMDLLSAYLAHENYDCVRAYVRDFRQGTRDLSAFLREHEPLVIVWDVSVPYRMNWAFLQKVKASGLLDRRGLVISTMNAAFLRDVAGGAEGVIEVSDSSEALAALSTALARHLVSA